MSPARSHSKACHRCAVAKAKCILGDSRRSCVRCLRLKRDCDIETKIGRHKEKKERSSRLTRIEQKIDRLLASVENQQNLSQPTLNHRNTTTYILENGDLEIEQADQILAIYKSTKMLQFPFVIIPYSTDASSLRRTAPFLFLCVIAVSIEDCNPSNNDAILGVKRTVSRAINQIISQAISRQDPWKGDADLAFLQGLIVYLAWSYYQLPVASKQIYLILQLAMNCASDLGLDNSQTLPNDLNNAPDQLAHNFYADRHNSLLFSKAVEYRTFLGCHYLCSSLSMLRARLPSSSEKWIHHCCYYLELWGQHPTDKSLKSLVEIRLLNACIYEAFPASSDLNSIILLENFRLELCRIESSSTLHVSDASYSLQIEVQFSTILLNLIAFLQGLPCSPHQDETRKFIDILLSVREMISYFCNLPPEILRHLPVSTTVLPWISFALMSSIAILPMPPDCAALTGLARVQVEETAKSIFFSLNHQGKEMRDFEGRNLVEKFLWCINCLVQWHRSQLTGVNAGLQLNNSRSFGGNMFKETLVSALGFLSEQLRCAATEK